MIEPGSERKYPDSGGKWIRSKRHTRYFKNSANNFEVLRIKLTNVWILIST